MTELSREAILAMGPGRELDELIGLKIMKAVQIKNDTLYNLKWQIDDALHLHMPKYSTDIAAAWEVVEELNGKYGILVQRLGDYFDEGPEWEGWEASFGGNFDRLVKAKTAPLAICKAALLTTLEESK